MTTPELITDEIVEKAVNAHRDVVSPLVCANGMRAAILAIQDDINRLWINLMRGYKQDAKAYEFGLKTIISANEGGKTCIYCGLDNDEHKYICPVYIAKKALKGDYHKTDFTKYCKENPVTASKPSCQRRQNGL